MNLQTTNLRTIRENESTIDDHPSVIGYYIGKNLLRVSRFSASDEYAIVKRELARIYSVI